MPSTRATVIVNLPVPVAQRLLEDARWHGDGLSAAVLRALWAPPREAKAGGAAPRALHLSNTNGGAT
jgi:hypothetical protein